MCGEYRLLASGCVLAGFWAFCLVVLCMVPLNLMPGQMPSGFSGPAVVPSGQEKRL